MGPESDHLPPLLFLAPFRSQRRRIARPRPATRPPRVHPHPEWPAHRIEGSWLRSNLSCKIITCNQAKHPVNEPVDLLLERHQLRQNFFAFTNNDIKRVTKVVGIIEWVGNIGVRL